ncbi:hypothetical protein TRIUR3_30536 [Triticum urartu]|uniref:Uncharacterized protein n=1 Tax=Triticum urartu TaxID=4572 RepID=M8AUL3_TRIUA|nr:hypothetical protein TRIUR3_30536 [Triticum urartu]
MGLLARVNGGALCACVATVARCPPPHMTGNFLGLDSMGRAVGVASALGCDVNVHAHTEEIDMLPELVHGGTYCTEQPGRGRSTLRGIMHAAATQAGSAARILIATPLKHCASQSHTTIGFRCICIQKILAHALRID